GYEKEIPARIASINSFGHSHSIHCLRWHRLRFTSKFCSTAAASRSAACYYYYVALQRHTGTALQRYLTSFRRHGQRHLDDRERCFARRSVAELNHRCY